MWPHSPYSLHQNGIPRDISNLHMEQDGSISIANSFVRDFAFGSAPWRAGTGQAMINSLPDLQPNAFSQHTWAAPAAAHQFYSYGQSPPIQQHLAWATDSQIRNALHTASGTDRSGENSSVSTSNQIQLRDSHLPARQSPARMRISDPSPFSSCNQGRRTSGTFSASSDRSGPISTATSSSSRRAERRPSTPSQARRLEPTASSPSNAPSATLAPFSPIDQQLQRVSGASSTLLSPPATPVQMEPSQRSMDSAQASPLRPAAAPPKRPSPSTIGSDGGRAASPAAARPPPRDPSPPQPSPRPAPPQPPPGVGARAPHKAPEPFFDFCPGLGAFVKVRQGAMAASQRGKACLP